MPFFNPGNVSIMISHLFSTLFPDQYRYLPYNRLINVLLRSFHILGFSVLTGGYWFGTPLEAMLPWLWLAAVTGTAMVVIELYGSFTFLIELRGLAVLSKLGLLLLIPYTGALAFWLLALVVVLASISSHMTGRLRHLSVVSPATISRLAGRTINP